MQIADQIHKISRLCQMGRELSSSTDTDELLAKISRCSSEVCESETASIILLDEERNEMYFKKVAGDMGEIIKRIRIPLNEHSIAGSCIINRRALIINDVSKDPRHYKGVDKATKFVTRSILAVPIIWGDKVFGCIEAVNKKNGKLFDEKDKEYLTILAHQAAVALNNVFLMERLKNFFSYSVEILISALETLEPYGKDHIFRVARLSVSLARRMGFEGKRLEEIWYAAYFHDVGKLARENIYMTQSEIERHHPETGASLIEGIKLLQNCVPYIRYHHERIDGSGFPKGLKGDEIPIGAQIIGIAEDYDEKRVSLNGEDIDDFNEKFIQYALGKFNKEIVENFSEVIKQMRSF